MVDRLADVIVHGNVRAALERLAGTAFEPRRLIKTARLIKKIYSLAAVIKVFRHGGFSVYCGAECARTIISASKGTTG